MKQTELAAFNRADLCHKYGTFRFFDSFVKKCYCIAETNIKYTNYHLNEQLTVDFI